MHELLHNMEWVEAVRFAYLTPLFRALTALGTGSFLILFLVFGFLAIHKTVFARAIAIVLVSALLNDWLKNYFVDPRPPQALWLDSSIADTFGFPSGHAQVAAALWLWLAYHVRQRWGSVLLILLAVGVALSRLYLGVHDVEDVLGGTAIGLMILALFLWWSGERMSDVRRRYAVLPLLAAMTLTAIAIVTSPGAESRAPILFGGLLCAFWFGYRIETRRLCFEQADSRRAAFAGVAGLLGMFAILALLSDLRHAPAMQIVPAVSFVGLYISLLAPMMMVRLGLLQRRALEETVDGDR